MVEPFFRNYTRLVPDADVVAAMTAQVDELVALAESIPLAQQIVMHAPYTWTLRQVLGHLCDTERVFGYRAFRISRGDLTPLPGFDEHLYVTAGRHDRRECVDHAREFAAVRSAVVPFFKNLTADQWTYAGTASNLTWSVDDLARAMVGHVRHHLAVVRQRIA